MISDERTVPVSDMRYDHTNIHAGLQVPQSIQKAFVFDKEKTGQFLRSIHSTVSQEEIARLRDESLPETEEESKENFFEEEEARLS